MLSAKPAGQTISQNSPLSRAASNRQSVNRHKVGETPKLDHSNISQAHREDAHTMSSPQLHPTPTSHVSSPSTAKSPGFNLQGGISIPGAEIQPQQQKDTSQLHQLLPPSILPASSHYSSNGNGSNGHHCISATSPDPATPMTAALPNVSPDSGVNMDRTGSGYYLSPFQKHYDQLGKLTAFPSIPRISLSFPPPLYGSLFSTRLINSFSPPAQNKNMKPKSTCSMKMSTI